MIDLGGHRLHVDCIGKGTPTVILENGFKEFSFDWILVQSKVATFTRVCVYDRAGYAWSNGDNPRAGTVAIAEVFEVAADKIPWSLAFFDQRAFVPLFERS